MEHSTTKIRTFISEFCRKAFGIDTRALAAFRVMISLILLCDLVIRAVDLHAHYTDWGLLPRNALLEFKNLTNTFSFHLISGAAVFQYALFALTIFFVLMMLFGIKTRLFSILTWAMIISLHNRNPAVLNGGDSLIRLLLFWAMFLPLGARFSVDAAYSKIKDKGYVCNIASFGFIIQIVFLYIFTGILKDSTLWMPENLSTLLKPSSEWYPMGSALYYALSIDQFTTTIGYWMLEQKTLLPYFTLGTYVLEVFGPILFFVPIGFVFFRTIGVFSFVALHFGIVLMMKVGWFPLIDIAALIAMLPKQIWDLASLKLGGLVTQVEHFIKDTCSISLKRLVKEKLHDPNPYFQPHIVTSLVLSFVLAYFLALNVQSVKKWKYRPPESIDFIETLIMSYQNWSMFAPYPMKDDGWFVIEGQLDDKSEADVYRQTIGQVDFSKPKCASCYYPSQRWRKFMMNLRRKKYEKYRLYFGKYLCRRWNDDPPEGKKLMTFQMYYMTETTLPNYRTSRVKKRQLWRHYCFKKGKD